MMAILALSVLALAPRAQYPGAPMPDRPGGGRPGLGRNGPHPPQSALMQALDLNHDGVIDAYEIAHASAALRTLDRNGDDKLTPDELMPIRASQPGSPAGDPSGRRPGQRRNGPRPPQSALMQALDANHDGVIDRREIANAPAALRKLDTNRDGRLTPDELWPAAAQEQRDLDGSEEVYRDRALAMAHFGWSFGDEVAQQTKPQGGAVLRRQAVHGQTQTSWSTDSLSLRIGEVDGDLTPRNQPVMVKRMFSSEPA